MRIMLHMFSECFIFLTEKTVVSIKGKVSKDSTKFEFKDVGSKVYAASVPRPIYTYLQMGTTGWLLQCFTILMVGGSLKYSCTLVLFAEPTCGADEFCSEPAFVKVSEGIIEPSKVFLPTVFKVSLTLIKWVLKDQQPKRHVPFHLILQNLDKRLHADGVHVQKGGLSEAEATCDSNKVCITQSTNGKALKPLGYQAL